MIIILEKGSREDSYYRDAIRIANLVLRELENGNYQIINFRFCHPVYKAGLEISIHQMLDAIDYCAVEQKR